MAITVKEIEEAKEKVDKMLESSKEWEGNTSIKLFTKSLESDYFWIKDFITGSLQYKLWKQDEKKAASVFSAFHGEFIQKKQLLEKRAMDISATISGVVQSVGRIMYDLREYDRMLEVHKQLKSKSKSEKEAAMLTAKRIFMDEVDIKKGRGAMNNLSVQLEFVTLRDAFMKAKSVEDGNKMDLNDRVKRILLERLREFFDWLPKWERTLTQQKNLLLSHLKSQYGSLKLYVQWIGPYLRDIRNLEFDEKLPLEKKMISVFDNNVIKIELFAIKDILSGEYRIVRGTDNVVARKIDKEIIKKGRKYNPKKGEETLETRKQSGYGPKAKKLLRIIMEFSSKPQQMMKDASGGTYRNIGNLDVEMSAHGFDEFTWKKFEKAKDKMEIKEEDLLISSVTEGSLVAMRDDIEKYLGEYEGEIKVDEKKKKPKKEKTPFFITEIFDSFKDSFSFLKPTVKEESLPKWKKKDTETIVKKLAKKDGEKLYKVYKGRHGLPG